MSAAARFGRTARRRLLLLLSLATLSASMLVAVRRSSEARRLSRELEALERAEDLARSALATSLVRADSLSSRARMISVGVAIGMRPATESEFEWVNDRRRPTRIARAREDEAADSEGRMQ